MTTPVPAVSAMWIDGALVDPDRATVSALDHGLTVGDGVFETMKVVAGVPFALGRHLRRLHRSADGLGLRVPFDDGQLRAACAEVSSADAGADHQRLRVTVTGGPGPLGSSRAEVPATVVIAAGPTPPPGRPESVVTVPWRRNEHGALAGLKTTSYGENVVALARAVAEGAGEAILANTAGALCEGTGTNVFIARRGRLLTPALTTGCLAGITRQLLLDLVEVEESDALGLDDLRQADEAFLTSSTRDVAPITAVDGAALAATPGPLTAEAREAFAALQARTLDP